MTPYQVQLVTRSARHGAANPALAGWYAALFQRAARLPRLEEVTGGDDRPRSAEADEAALSNMLRAASAAAQRASN